MNITCLNAVGCSNYPENTTQEVINKLRNHNYPQLSVHPEAFVLGSLRMATAY